MSGAALENDDLQRGQKRAVDGMVRQLFELLGDGQVAWLIQSRSLNTSKVNMKAVRRILRHMDGLPHALIP